MSGCKLLLFAGTMEGRKLAQWLSQAGICAVLCVATEYGKTAVPELPGIEVLSGRMTRGEMACLMRELDCDQVIDATHPYATEVTENILEACRREARPYLRIIRLRIEEQDGIAVAYAEEAAAYLREHPGKALLTTGSKELECFTKMEDFARRLYPRVLPDPAVIEKCLKMGFAPGHLICMQGPFTRELNEALLRSTGAKYLVTKDSGDTGGLPEKLAAAKAAGAKVILINRPTRENGLTLEEAIGILENRYGIRKPASTLSPSRFPLFISLENVLVTVFGGGKVALRRLRTLLPFRPRLKVITEEALPELMDLAEKKALELELRAYIPGDVQGAGLILAATSDPDANRRICAEAERLGVPASSASSPQDASFWFPAVIREEGLTIGLVSENGDDHTLVKNTAEKLRGRLREFE